MLKYLIKKTVLKLFPELAAGLHMPLLAIVVKIPDPPTGGDICDEFTPKYAVDCRLLKADFSIDNDMPLMRDVPVALSGAAPDRGLALLPQPGTIVEIAFAFGLQTHPYIRAVLPLFRKLPKIDAASMRWQQTAASFLQVDATGNWRQVTDKKIDRQSGAVITDRAAIEISTVAPKIWTGSPAENMWTIVSEFMQTTSSALFSLSSHTHTPVLPSDQREVANAAQAITAQKTRLDIIKK